jgi:hypothetical protein
VKRSILGVLLVLAFVAVGIAAAPALKFTFSDVHANKTATETDSYAVNNAGTIAGDYVDSAAVQHGMILAGTKLTTVDSKSCAASTFAFYGINNKGAEVGWCISAKTGLDLGLVYAKGKFTSVNFPKSTGTQATGINDTGEVVGLYLDSTSVQHGFVKKGSKYTSIDVKGETAADAYGINNAGDIAVYATNSSGFFDAFLYNGKTFKNINDPNAKGTTGTVAHSPNNKGDVTGTYYDSAGNVHGWLLHAGKYYDVNDPKGASDSRSDGLNDKLEMVGRYSTTLGGASIGFKATTKQ